MYFNLLFNLAGFNFESINPYSYWLAYFPSWIANPLEVDLKFCTSDFLFSFLVEFHQFPLGCLLRISKECKSNFIHVPTVFHFSMFSSGFPKQNICQREKSHVGGIEILLKGLLGIFKFSKKSMGLNLSTCEGLISGERKKKYNNINTHLKTYLNKQKWQYFGKLITVKWYLNA